MNISSQQELDALLAEFRTLEAHQRSAFLDELPRDNPFRQAFFRTDFEIANAEFEERSDADERSQALSPRSAAELLVRRRDGR